MLYFISQGAGLGLTAALIPGVVHTYMMNQTLLHGLRRSIVVMAAPLVADIPLIIITTLLLDQLPDAVVRALQIAGGLFILWLAWGAWRLSQANPLFQVSQADSASRGIFFSALLINWLNPAPYIFWGTVNGPLLAEALEQSALHGLAFLAAFYIPLCGMIGLVGLFFNRLRHLDERYIRWIIRGAVGLMVFFALSFLYRGVMEV
jgi:threonine/homoserine/homoserine lactone efflux protein